MNILQVDGFTERSGDWTLAKALRDAGHYVEERECVQNWGNNGVALIDVQRAKGVAVYSWGMASFDDVAKGTLSVDLLITVLGVPDGLKGQHSGSVWYKTSGVTKVVCLQVQRAWPTSEWFRDVGNVWIDYNDPDLLTKALDPASPVVNINFDKMPELAGKSGLEIHTQFMNLPEVQALIVKLFNATEAAAMSQLNPSVAT